MKNYFLPRVTAADMEKLQRSAVDFCQFIIDPDDGVVVDEENLPRALEILGAEIETETATSLEGIVAVSLRQTQPVVRPAPKPTTSVKVGSGGWNGRNEGGFIEAVQEILLPVTDRNVILHVPHGDEKAPASDGQFHIWIWSTPDGRSTHAPEKIWDMKVDCPDGVTPSKSVQGIPIVDAATNWMVGELVGDSNLYIHHDLCHQGTDRELAIFRRLLEEVVLELSGTPEDKAERQRKLAEAQRKASREAYIKECSSRFEKTLKGTREAIKTGHADVARIQQELVRRIRETAGSERKLEQLEAARGGELDKYGVEFDKLLVVPKVRDVQVADGVVKVFTDTLYCTDPRDKVVREIGKFRIEIFRDGGNRCVRWYNLDRKVDGYESGMNAPHVFNDGHACLGNTQEIFPELIANYEFAAAAMVAIQFVESVNVDDSAGKHVKKWPEAPAEMQEARHEDV